MLRTVSLAVGTLALICLITFADDVVAKTGFEASFLCTVSALIGIGLEWGRMTK